jgi:hypothetical protein
MERHKYEKYQGKDVVGAMELGFGKHRGQVLCFYISTGSVQFLKHYTLTA